MDEIESLIGEAVRVEMDRPAPVVTPVGGLAPRRTQPIDPKPEPAAPRSADEAILAAAAATGAEVGMHRFVRTRSARRAARHAAPCAPPLQQQHAPVHRHGRCRHLLLAAGFGLYWVLGMGRGDGTVPVLTADASPVKVAPDPTTTGSNLTLPSSPVLNELDGVDDTATGETLVSTDQSTPTDVAAVSGDEVMESASPTARSAPSPSVRMARSSPVTTPSPAARRCRSTAPTSPTFRATPLPPPMSSPTLPRVSRRTRSPLSSPIPMPPRPPTSRSPRRPPPYRSTSIRASRSRCRRC